MKETKINDKQTFHTFLFNIRNYSPNVINIQRRQAELNIMLPRLGNFVKLKKILPRGTNAK